MTEVRPFRALLYNPARAGPPASNLSPPYDVIDPGEEAELRRRSPYNAVWLELPRAAPGQDPYRTAAEALARWLAEGVLRYDQGSALYVYDQTFAAPSGPRTRRALLVALRLQEWAEGQVLPHERTFAAPKSDRLNLLRACRTNLSPIFILYADDRGEVLQLLAPGSAPPLLAFVSPEGGAHRLWRLEEPDRIEAVRAALARRRLYVADGHHRYETALNHREEVRRASARWSGEEPENFVLAGLTADTDPGLLIFPYHRLVRGSPAPDLRERLAERFLLEDGGPVEGLNAATLAERLAPSRRGRAGGYGTTFGVLGLEPGRLAIARLVDFAGVETAIPPDRAEGWRRLDVNVLEYAVLRPLLGILGQEGGRLGFTHDAAQAAQAVESGAYSLAFLLNPPSVRQVMALADAGERMPQKSTYFYPKLPAGLLFRSLSSP